MSQETGGLTYGPSTVAMSLHRGNTISTGAGGSIAFNTTVNNAGPSRQFRDKRSPIDWLASMSSVNHYAIQKATYENLAPKTGEWILQDPKFSAWMSQRSGIFWGVGIPGAGKTYLTSFVIHHLERSVPGSTVLFVYCRFSDNLSVSKILAALLQHCVESSLAAMENVKKTIYTTCQEKNVTPSQSDLINSLRANVALIGKTFIVVDALDELKDDTREELIKNLLLLKQPLFLTSRELTLDILGSPTIQIYAKREDLGKHIEAEVSRLPKLRSLLEERQDVLAELIEHIQLKSDGMFLLSTLYLSALGGITSIRNLRNAIQDLPKSLTAMYELTFSRIASQSEEEQSLAHRALLWVTYATRSLNLKELLEVLSIDLDSTTIDRDALTNGRTLTSVCCGLITIEAKTDTVRLIHYTAHNFLTSQRTGLFQHPHHFAANMCAAYLSLSEKSQKDEIPPWELDFMGIYEKVDRHPYLFAKYASCNLGYHTYHAILPGESKIPDRVLLYLNTKTNILLLWHPNPVHKHDVYLTTAFGTKIEFAALHGLVSLAQQGIGSPKDDSSRDPGLPLIYACIGGHIAIVEVLLGVGEVELNAQNTEGDTALHMASTYGHAAIVRLLLDVPGIDVNSQNRQGNTPLHVACIYGHEPIIQILLSSPTITVNILSRSRKTALGLAAEEGHELIVGMLLGTPGIITDTALLAASERGHERIVQLLLGYPQTNANARSHDGYSSLHLASRNGFHLVVHLLLQVPGIEVNAQDDNDMTTALYMASLHNHNLVVRLLLNSPDIDVNLKNKDGSTALAIASSNGHEQVVELLLGVPQIDVNARRWDGAGALCMASTNGHQQIVQLLLGIAHIDVNCRSRDGPSILYMESEKGHELAVRLLVTFPEIDANARSGSGLTPLHIASKNHHREIIRLLLDIAHIDINARCEDGSSALHIASKNGDESIVRLLLDCPRLDINARGECNLTALHLAFEGGYRSTVHLLLSSPDIDVVARGANSSTILHLAASSDDTEVVKRVLNIPGLDVNARNDQGRTALFIATSDHHHESVAEMILNHPDTDVNAQDKHGKTPLENASWKGHEPVVRLLLNAPRLNLVSQDNYRPGALHFACMNGHDSVVRLLLSMPGIKVNATNKEGWTPLHFASYKGHEKVVRLLLGCSQIDIAARTISSRGVYPPIQANNCTALDIAAKAGHRRVVAILEEPVKRVEEAKVSDIRSMVGKVAEAKILDDVEEAATSDINNHPSKLVNNSIDKAKHSDANQPTHRGFNIFGRWARKGGRR